MTKALILALALVSPALAHADTKAIQKTWQDCLDSEDGQSTMGMIQCNGDAYQAADAELNVTYKAIMKTIKANADKNYVRDATAFLKQAERDWIKFRDSNCQLPGLQNYGGTLSGVQETGCRADAVIKRVDELNELFN